MLIHSAFHRLSLNEHGRDFIVGDLHGQQAMLDLALRTVDFDPSCDRLVALGDLVDRGPDSVSLLRLLDSAPWFVSVVGNHEALLWSRFESSRRALRDGIGDQWQVEIPRDQVYPLSRIVAGMPLALELPLPDGRNLGLVHAEVPIGKHWHHVREVSRDSLAIDATDDAGRTLASSLLWGRRRMGSGPERHPPVHGIDDVYAGHSVTPDRRPHRERECVFIDTGAFLKHGRLTLVEPGANHYWQIERRDGAARNIATGPTVLP